MNVTPGSTSNQVAGEVRAWMARHQRSARSIALELGWTETYLSRRLTGSIPFNVAELDAIAGLLDVPVQVFFEGPGNVRDLARSRGPEDAFYGPAAVAA